jgi:hypothetical protein
VTIGMTTSTTLVLDALEDLRHGVVSLAAWTESSDLTAVVTAWDACEQLRREIADLAADLAAHAHGLMPEKRVEVEGFGLVERTTKADRKRWDTEALRSAVLDSRLVDPETGEVADETPLDKVLHVWNLGAPRLTALRARGIDAPDDFCAVEFGAKTIRMAVLK